MHRQCITLISSLLTLSGWVRKPLDFLKVRTSMYWYILVCTNWEFLYWPVPSCTGHTGTFQYIPFCPILSRGTGFQMKNKNRNKFYFSRESQLPHDQLALCSLTAAFLSSRIQPLATVTARDSDCSSPWLSNQAIVGDCVETQASMDTDSEESNRNLQQTHDDSEDDQPLLSGVGKWVSKQCCVSDLPKQQQSPRGSLWNPILLVRGSTRWYVLVHTSTSSSGYEAVREMSKLYIPVHTGSYGHMTFLSWW